MARSTDHPLAGGESEAMGVEGDWDETKTGKGMKNAPALGVRLCGRRGAGTPGAEGGGRRASARGVGGGARFFLCQRVRRLVSTALVAPRLVPATVLSPPPPKYSPPPDTATQKSVPRTVPSTRGRGPTGKRSEERCLFLSARGADTRPPPRRLVSPCPLFSPDPGAAPHPLGDAQPARLWTRSPHTERERRAGAFLIIEGGRVSARPHNVFLLEPPPPPRA